MSFCVRLGDCYSSERSIHKGKLTGSLAVLSDGEFVLNAVLIISARSLSFFVSEARVSLFDIRRSVKVNLAVFVCYQSCRLIAFVVNRNSCAFNRLSCLDINFLDNNSSFNIVVQVCASLETLPSAPTLK